MEVLYSSYTMGTCGSPDIYTLSPWACGPQASGVYIRQTTYAHGTTIKYTLRNLNYQRLVLYTVVSTTVDLENFIVKNVT